MIFYILLTNHDGRLKKMNEPFSVSKKFFLLLSVAALRTAVGSNGTLCTKWIYQPQAPKSLLKLAK